MNPRLSQKIAVDCDGILADTVSPILKYNNYKFAGKELYYNDILHHNFHQIPGFEHATRDQAFDIFQNFLIDPELHMTISPIEGAFQRLSKLKSEGYNLDMVTARGPFLKNITIDWLSIYFPNIFDDCHFINHTMKDKETTKSSICLDIGAETMIEDAPHNAIDTANHGIYTFLMRRPWNRIWLEQNQDYPNIKAVSSWEEIG